MTDLKFSCLFVQNHAADRIPRHYLTLRNCERIQMCCRSIMINGSRSFPVFIQNNTSPFFEDTQLSTSADPQLAFASKGYNTRVLNLYNVSHRNRVYLFVPQR
jgi:hypothetical protein